MDETLQYFLAAIEAQSWQEIDSVASSVADDHGEKTDRVRADAERRAEEYLRTERARIEQQARFAADTRLTEHRRELLALRAEYARQVTDAVKERIRAYAESPEYPARLAALAERAAAALHAGDGQRVTVWLRQEDMCHAAFVCESLKGVTAEVKQGDFVLGGVAAEADGRRADLTFDTAMRSADERFAALFETEII